MLMSMRTSVHDMSGIITVFSNTKRLAKCLRNRMPNIRFQEVIPGQNSFDEDLISLQSAEILVTDCDLIAPHLYNLPSLKWVQSTWAGADVILKAYDPKRPPLNFTITRFTGQYFGALMGEYVISNVFIHERNWAAMKDNREEHIWLKNIESQENIKDYRGVCDLTFGILGLGNIGKEIASALKALKGTVWGMVRTIAEEKPGFIDQIVLQSDLPQLLQACDYVISILPSTDETIGLLNGDMLKHCHGKGTVLINIGRGTVIDEGDLITALEQKWLSKAILDVFQTEPLPQTSALWKHPQVMITPHMSGVSRAEHFVEVFEANLKRYNAGQPLAYILDPSRGY